MAEDGTTQGRAAERAPVSVTDLQLITDTGQMFVTELLRREGRVDEPAPPDRSSWMCRLGAVLACSALAFGAVIAGTTALSGPRSERAAPSSPVPASIVGAEALRPDLINASIELPALPSPGPDDLAAAGSPAVAAPASPPQQPHTVRTLPGPADPPAPAAATPPPAGPGAHPSGSERDRVLGTVAAFYENVAVTPQQAFALLDPQMRGSGYQDFRNSWSGVQRVTVDDLRLDGPNAVLVIASLERSDGTVLRTLQRVLVTPGAEPRITDARLLSASRS